MESSTKSIAITGHTMGLGLAISNRYRANGYSIKGYSLDNGYKLPDDIDSIITDSEDVSIFVNNAYDADTNGVGQEELLWKLYERWYSNPTKSIITIGSIGSYFSGSYSPIKFQRYLNQKSHIHNIHFSLANRPETSCRMLLVEPGYMNTNMVKRVDMTGGGMIQKKVVDPGVVANLIFTVQQTPGLLVTNMTIRTDLDGIPIANAPNPS